MDFSLGYSPWLLLLSLAVAGAFTYWSYRATVPALSAGRRALLGGLRFVALALICFLLFEPILRQLQQSERPPILAVLVDNSESMRIVTGGSDTSSAQAARDSIRPLLNRFREDTPGSIRYYSFDRSTRALSQDPTDSLTFDAAQTDISSALLRVREELTGENLRGIALVSDGQYNTGRNPLRVAERSPVPIHTVTVGDTTRRRDLRIRDVATNDRAYLDSAVPVRVSLAANEGSGEPVTVTLSRNGTVVDQTEIQLPQGAVDIPVDLTYRPESAGFQQLTVQVSELPGEVTTRNNTQSVSLRVLENKRRVLLLGAAPSPSFTAIRRVFERNADTNVSAYVPRQDGSFYGGTLPDTLSNIDVVVLAGFPSPPVPNQTTERIAQLVDDGTPTLFFLDRQADVTAWTESFESALPAMPSTSNVGFTQAQFSVSSSARQHPVFRIEEGPLDFFGRLPPLHVPSSPWTPSPDAQVLAGAEGPSFAESAPLLVVRRRAGHRTAAFLATGLWRWALLPSELSQTEPLWPGLVSNLLRWVSTEAVDQPVRVRPTTPTFDGGEHVQFTGQVYDESMQPVPDATVEITVADSTGRDYPYTMNPTGRGQFTLDVGTLPEGTYEYDARATLGQTELGTDEGRFSVDQLQLEYRSTRADPVFMRQLAARSGGRAYTPQSARGLPALLEDAESFSSEVVQNTSQTELWQLSLFLIVILLLLAAEWTLRKRYGLT